MTPTVSRRWIAVLAAVLGLAVIIACQLGPNRYRMEDRLAQRATDALVAAGRPEARVSFAGRDALVVAGSEEQAEQARAVVAGVSGVRTVGTRVDRPAPVPPSAGQLAAEQRAREDEERARKELAERQRASAVHHRLKDLPSLTFHTGGAQLTAESRETLREVADLLAENEGVTIRVEGHTDSRGPAATNLALSRDRAAAVKDALAGYGVAADRLTTAGYGEARPAVPNDTTGHRAENRRVELNVTSPLG